MQYKTFFLPIFGSEQAEMQLNSFLRTNRIITVQKEFLQNERGWCFLVEYTNDADSTKATGKVDYMKILSQEDFAIFSKLRELRKTIAAQEQIPAYAVFTDEQLSHIAREKPDTLQKLQKINGIGSAKAEKYGNIFIKLLVEKSEISNKNEPDIF